MSTISLTLFEVILSMIVLSSGKFLDQLSAATAVRTAVKVVVSSVVYTVVAAYIVVCVFFLCPTVVYLFF